ncbi:MAG: hypothetical protein IPO02_13855 [Bacteroidetes bacterium]|nr:hypothetical protein [Bacteroidota bacterium]
MLYSVIDMNANGGAGKVVKRMIPFATNGQFPKTQMMACRHSNGKDWWFLKQGVIATRFISFALHKTQFIIRAIRNLLNLVGLGYIWTKLFNKDGSKYTSS